MDYLMSRRAYAFCESVDQLFENNGGKIYMWTFTWAKPHNNDYYRQSWKNLIREFKKHWPLLGGLRVFEMHGGSQNLFGESHGLHVHALLNDRIPIARLRKLSDKCGMGRIHVQKCNPDQAKYLAKYLTKKAEVPLPKGMRAFGTVCMNEGSGGYTRVRDIEMTSPFTRNVATWQQRLRVKQMGPDLIHTIYVNSQLYGDVANWPINRLYYHGKRAKQVFCDLALEKPKAKTMERRALEWKNLGCAIIKKSGAIRPPKAEKIFGNSTRGVPGVSSDRTVERVDIGADYWDKFPGKTDGTRIAYYRVCK